MKIDIPTNGDNAKTLSWVVRGFFGAIADAYETGAPRHVEAYKLVSGMVSSARANGEISNEEEAEIRREIALLA
jgi:hypothetical protein